MRKFSLILSCFASAAVADDYQIVTSIAPVQGLVAELAAGAQTPELLVPAGADPHEFSLRPSQIRSLQTADLIVLAGNGMEPWWDDVADLVSADATVLILGSGPSVAQYAVPMRQDPGVRDPHMWTDPDVAGIWAERITLMLRTIDPENAGTYDTNLQSTLLALAEVAVTSQAQLAPIKDVQLVFGHDSLQYFELAFGLKFGGALSDAHGTEAGAQTVSSIAGLEGPACLVIDINEADDHGHALIEDAPSVQLDPLGSTLLGQPNFAAALIAHLAEALASCAPS